MMFPRIFPSLKFFHFIAFSEPKGFCPKYPVGNILFRTTFTLDSSKCRSRLWAKSGHGTRTVASAVSDKENRGRRGKECCS